MRLIGLKSKKSMFIKKKKYVKLTVVKGLQKNNDYVYIVNESNKALHYTFLGDLVFRKK